MVSKEILMSTTKSRKNSEGGLQREIERGSSIKMKKTNHDHVFGD